MTTAIAVWDEPRLAALDALHHAVARLGEREGARMRRGGELGVIVATQDGDSEAILPLVDAFDEVAARSGRVSSALFEGIAHVPTGRLLKAATDALGALGPSALLRDAGARELEQLARLWGRVGRARQVAIVTVERESHAAESSASADARLLDVTSPVACEWGTSSVDVTAAYRAAPSDEGSDDDADTLLELVGDALRAVAGSVGDVAPERRGFVFASFLGNRPSSLRARTRGHEVPAFPTAADMLARAAELPVGGPRLVLHGMPGASITALAIAADLVAVGDVDQMVVCGVDVVGRTMTQSLTTVRCEDKPFFRSGVAALVVERPGARRPALRRLGPIGLFTPPARRHIPLTLDGCDVAPLRAAGEPAAIVTSGCLDFDLRNARTIAAALWPNAAPRLVERRTERYLGADAAMAVVDGLHVAIVAANALGGSGVIVSRPPETRRCQES